MSLAFLKPLKTQKSREKFNGETQKIEQMELPESIIYFSGSRHLFRQKLVLPSTLFDDYRNHKGTFYWTYTPSLPLAREGNEKILGGRKAKSIVCESHPPNP